MLSLTLISRLIFTSIKMGNKQIQITKDPLDNLILLSDFLLAALAALIYFWGDDIGGYCFSPPLCSAIILVNLSRTISILPFHFKGKVGSNAILVNFAASNIIFINFLEFVIPNHQIYFEPFYFLLIVFTTYRWKPKKVLYNTLLISFALFLSYLPSKGFHSLISFTIQFLFIWLFYLFIKSMLERFRSSQAKLMESMDSLNKRTWELEMAQAETEMIYNTVADIAGTLNFKEVVEKIIRIATHLLGAKTCKVCRLLPDGLYVNIVGEGNRKTLEVYDKVKKISLTELLRDFEGNEMVTSTMAISTLRKGIILNGNRSQAIIPLIVREKFIGLIILESVEASGFPAEEKREFTILGPAASMAMDNAILLQKAEEMATVDELTGMYNFRYFREKLQSEVQRAIRYDLELTILIIDIDFFKKVNDTYGHQAGNMLLQQLSGLLRRCVRDVDILSRYGGEEFVIILPQTELEAAEVVAERIRSEVENAVFECGPEAMELKITVSIGLGCFSKEIIKTPEALIEEADTNLYTAKRTGRNKIVYNCADFNACATEESPVNYG